MIKYAILMLIGVRGLGTFSSEHLSCSTNELSTLTQDLRSASVRGRVKAFSPFRAGDCRGLVDAIVGMVLGWVIL